MADYLRRIRDNERAAKLANLVAEKFTQEGLLIAAGFAAFHATVISPYAPEDQVREMRFAFFAGAQHLFASIIGILDPGQDPTDDDFKRMDLIAGELNAFADELELRLATPEGRA